LARAFGKRFGENQLGVEIPIAEFSDDSGLTACCGQETAAFRPVGVVPR